MSEVADSFIEMLLNEVAAADDINMLPGAYLTRFQALGSDRTKLGNLVRESYPVFKD